MDEVGLAALERGDLDETERWFTRAFEIQKTIYPPTHMTNSFSLPHLARVQADRGNLPEAISLYEESLKVRVAGLGTDHPDVATSEFLLGGMKRRNGDLEEAEQHLPANEFENSKDPGRGSRSPFRVGF